MREVLKSMGILNAELLRTASPAYLTTFYPIAAAQILKSSEGMKKHCIGRLESQKEHIPRHSRVYKTEDEFIKRSKTVFEKTLDELYFPADGEIKQSNRLYKNLSKFPEVTNFFNSADIQFHYMERSWSSYIFHAASPAVATISCSS